MFDVGFSEMLLVALIALLVFGPDRLPRVAREVALWIRKVRIMASSVKQEIDRELQLQELKETLEQQRREMDLMRLPDKASGIPARGDGAKPDAAPDENPHE